MLSVVKLPYRDEYQVGVGVNALNGNLAMQGVTGLKTQILLNPATDTSFTTISSREDYERTVQGEVNAEGSGMGWAVSGSVGFLNEQSTSDTNLTFVATVTKRTQTDKLDMDYHGQLTDEALLMLKHDPANFLNYYGTHFIGGFVHGGVFLGTISMQTHTSTIKDSLTASFRASIHSWLGSGSVDATYQSEQRNCTTSYNLTAVTYYDGVKNLEVSTSFDTMKQAAVEFGTNITGGSPISAICYPWLTLPQVQGIVAGFNADEKKAFGLDVDLGVFKVLSDGFADLSYMRSSLNTIVEHRFPAQRKTIVTAQEQVNDCIRLIAKLTFGDIAGLTVAGARQKLAPPDLQVLVNLLMAGELVISWNTFADGAFQDYGSASGMVAVEKFLPHSVCLVENPHNRDPQHSYPVEFCYIFDANNTRPYMQAKLYVNGNEYNGNPVYLDLVYSEPPVSKASWTGADWNFIAISVR